MGGIIGAEIDGGRDKTTGAVVGAIAGAVAGAAIADGGDDYDYNGRHKYEREAYVPPNNARSCQRYEPVDGGYECVKWRED